MERGGQSRVELGRRREGWGRKLGEEGRIGRWERFAEVERMGIKLGVGEEGRMGDEVRGRGKG